MSQRETDTDDGSNPRSDTDGPRITFCITELDVGGAEKALVNIAIGLQQRNWNVRVVSLRDDGPLAEPLRASGIDIASLQCGGFADARCFFRLQKELKRHPADIVLSFLHQANIYGRLAARFANVPIAVSGIRVADRRMTVTLPERLTRCCVTQYVAVSESVGRTHAELCRIPPSQMVAIPNGVDVPDDTTTSRPQRDNREILFVGRLTEQKDPQLLLSAFQRLPADLQRSTTLSFVGDGPLKEQLQQQISDHNLSALVKLGGRSNDVAALMRKADLLVLPSRWEGMPNVILEAMAHGLPVIATAVDGSRDLISDGETGWLLHSRDAAELATLMESVLTNPEKAQQTATQALKSVRETFTWASVIERYDTLLRDLLLKNSGHGV